MICVSLGILLLHTKVRDGANKGKVERHFRTMKERWLYTLDIDSITSLAQFNGMLRDYMHSYTTTFHRGIDTTPFDRYENTKQHPRRPLSREWLMTVFTTGLPVSQKRFYRYHRQSYVWMFPCSYICQVDIRYLPDDMASAFILFEEEKFPLRLTNRNENCHTKRNNLTIDYAKAGGAN